MTGKRPGANLLDKLVEQFDALWQQGRRPNWTAWLQQALERASQLRQKAEAAPYQAESLAAIRKTYAATKNKSKFRKVVDK